jgi:hypothetical protein
MAVYRVKQSPDTANHRQQFGLSRRWLSVRWATGVHRLPALAKELDRPAAFCNDESALPTRCVSFVITDNALYEPTKVFAVKPIYVVATTAVLFKVCDGFTTPQEYR